MTTAVVPGKAPRTDQELVRSFHDRISRLEQATTTRVGPWVMSADPTTGNLIATRPGSTSVDLTDAGPTTIDLGSLSSYVTKSQLSTALANIPAPTIDDGGGGGLDLDSIWNALYAALTGIGQLDPTDAITTLAEFLKSELGGLISSDRLPLIPLSHIRDLAPNLNIDGDFTDPSSLAGLPDWTHDATDGYGAVKGCAVTTADGTGHTIHSVNIEVSAGDVLNVSARAKWINLVSTAGSNPLRIRLSAYTADGTIIGAPTVAVQIAASGTSGGTDGWGTLLNGTPYTVPDSATYVVMELIVTDDATAGTVKYDKATVNKSGTFPQEYVSGLVAGLSSIWDGIQSRIEDFADLLDVFGGFGVGTGQGQLTDVATRIQHLDPVSGLLNVLGLPDDIPTANVPGLSQIADQVKGAIEGGNPVGTAIDEIKGTIGGFLDFLRQGASGTAQTGSTASETGESIDGLRQSITAANAKLAQIISGTDSGPGIVGSAYSDDAERSVAGSWGPGWDLGGSGSVSNNGHDFVWDAAGSAARSILGRYSVGATLTDYQLIQFVMGSLMDSPGFFTSAGSDQGNGMVGRCDVAKTNYVYARIRYNKAELGCVVGGVQVIFATQAVRPTSGARWSLQLGTADNARQFILQMNGSTIINYTDLAATSVMGINNRWGGQAMWSDAHSGGESEPGTINIWALSDEQPSGIVGTTFRAHRTNAAQVTVPTGQVMLPNGALDTVDYISADLTWLPNSNCGVQVTKAGTYMASLRINGTGAFTSGTAACPGVYKNGQPIGWGTTVGSEGSAGFSVPIPVVDSIFSTMPVYANAGDIIQPGAWSANFSPAFVGDATGNNTYFSLVKVG